MSRPADAVTQLADHTPCPEPVILARPLLGQRFQARRGDRARALALEADGAITDDDFLVPEMKSSSVSMPSISVRRLQPGQDTPSATQRSSAQYCSTGSSVSRLSPGMASAASPWSIDAQWQACTTSATRVSPGPSKGSPPPMPNQRRQVIVCCLAVFSTSNNDAISAPENASVTVVGATPNRLVMTG